MKITLQQIDKGKDEVIIKYKQMTEQIDHIVSYIEGKGGKTDWNKGWTGLHTICSRSHLSGKCGGNYLSLYGT